MSSDFERVGYLVLSGSRKSLKIEVAGHIYYVAVADVQRVLREPKFAAQVLKVKQPAQLFKNQSDYSYEKSLGYTRDAQRRHYKRFKCSTIRELGFCLEDCPRRRRT